MYLRWVSALFDVLMLQLVFEEVGAKSHSWLNVLTNRWQIIYIMTRTCLSVSFNFTRLITFR